MLKRVLELDYDVEGVLTFEEKNEIQEFLDQAKSGLIIYNTNAELTVIKDIEADEICALGFAEVVDLLEDVIVDEEFEPILDYLKEKLKDSEKQLYMETDFMNVYQDEGYAYFTRKSDGEVIETLNLDSKNLLIRYVETIELLDSDSVLFIDKALAELLLEELDEAKPIFKNKEELADIVKGFA